MSKKTKVAGNPALDATLPDVSIELGGETYHLCFDYAALSVAERKLSNAGIKVNLLEALELQSIGAERLPIVFFASLIKAQPSITFEEVKALVTMKTFLPIFQAVVDAFVASMAEPSGETADPPLPAAE
jgi:hypothetical protein